MDALKLDVLKTLYVQQQSTAHILRERISKINVGTITLFVVIDGWLVTNRQVLSVSHAVLLTGSIIVIAGVAIYALRARYKEFSAVARLIVRIEKAMKIYETGVYIGGQSLYPEAYEDLGKDTYKHGKNIFLSEVYILIIFALLSVFLVIFA